MTRRMRAWRLTAVLVPFAIVAAGCAAEVEPSTTTSSTTRVTSLSTTTTAEVQTLVPELDAATSAPGAPRVAVTGDIACDPAHASFNGGLGTGTVCRQLYTSDIVVNGGFDAALLLGDTQYECGGAAAFQQSYDISWGRVKSITRPSPGHHEYLTSGGTDCPTTSGTADPYFDYFNGVGNFTGPAGDRDKGYYSFDLGAWHIIALNSVCGPAGGCESGSPQEVWLANDLAASTKFCSVAYMHSPRWSTAQELGNPDLADLYQTLYDGGVDVILAAHVHSYQRFAPQNPQADLDNAFGIRQFIVGTGGKNVRLGDFIPGVPNWEVWEDDTFGVLSLTLNPGSYDWEFIPEAGQTFTDTGSQACHAPPGDEASS